MNVLQGENQGSLALVMCDMTVAWRKDVCVCVCVLGGYEGRTT